MDLKTYEQVKFELAELIRYGQLIASGKDKDSTERWQSEQPWHDLLTRLAEDRFTVVVAGRFNRGKSSLMNAVLRMDRLPTGLVPLTSVITNVRYGTSERVLLDYYGSGLRGEAKLEDLPQLVTEKGNPGNAKYGGMDVSQAQEAKQLRDENTKLRKLVADLSLDKEALQSVIRKNGWSS